MRALCVIPARIGSTRLPNKPLQLVAGEPLVSFVTRRILGFRLFDDVVVATDSELIAQAIGGLPVEVVLTSPEHKCGTERVAEVMLGRTHTHAVNVQSDEAFIPLKAITGVLEMLDNGHSLATAAMDLTAEQRDDEHTTKIAVNPAGRAVRFHRTMSGLAPGDTWVGRHVGIYGYEREALIRWASADQSPDEIALGLEQLRPMSFGASIEVARLSGTGCTGIDTPSDLEAAELHMIRSTERVHI